MVRLLADENFNHKIVCELRRRKPDLDLICVQEVGLSGADDPTILEWAAQENRMLLTYDVTTMTRYAIERVRAGLAMPGVFEVDRSASIGEVIDSLLLLVEASIDGEWEGRVEYIPWRT